MTLPGLPDLREQIDAIDQQIVQLVRRRLELVLKVGEIKRVHGVRVYDPERERRILEELARAAQPPLKPETVRRIFERIIDESRSQEQHHVRESAPVPAPASGSVDPG